MVQRVRDVDGAIAPSDALRRSASGISHHSVAKPTEFTNSANTPIEVLERSYGLRVRALRIRLGSGGGGSAPGGEGIERELEALEGVVVSLIAERHRSQPWGLMGGGPGASGEHWLLPGGSEHEARRLPDKCVVQLEPGDVLRVRTPGGGGWGTVPHHRSALQKSE